MRGLANVLPLIMRIKRSGGVRILSVSGWRSCEIVRRLLTGCVVSGRFATNSMYDWWEHYKIRYRCCLDGD
eukprot:7927457-Pyramimonas_sp.AAC.1